ncbi:MAG: PAS domain S-box protein [Leptospiraceae bacterium]|nr:PAS domain S-box protein [Leptospiraceae bacterium]
MNERIRAYEMFHLLVESVPNSIVLIDSKGIIKFANVQTERYFGYHINDLLGKQIEY